MITHTKATKSKIAALILGLTMCLALILGIVFASPTFAVYAAGETQIDTLGVAFKKVGVGDTLDAAFEFENATTKTLKVPGGSKLYCNAYICAQSQRRTNNKVVGKRRCVAPVEQSRNSICRAERCVSYSRSFQNERRI